MVSLAVLGGRESASVAGGPAAGALLGCSFAAAWIDTAMATAADGHSVHVVATIPGPVSYRFRAGGFTSAVGKAATAVVSDTLRIAAASCQHFETGYYAAHRDIAAWFAGFGGLLIAAALAHHQGSRAATADSLGINRKTLFNKMREYGINSKTWSGA